MSTLEIHIQEKRFPGVGDAPARLIYRDFRLAVERGSFLAILGPSGIGKSTLLNLVAGLDQNFRGTFGPGEDSAPRLAYVFQSPRLLPWRTVLENVLLPLPNTADAKDRARSLVAEVGLAEAEAVYPERLSLGMQRRVALARAFAVGPDLLLMDEPFASLDEATAQRLRDLLLAVLEKRRTTVLFVTHDSREAIELADRIVVLGGSPARVVRDERLGLERPRGRDPATLEELRARLQA